MREERLKTTLGLYIVVAHFAIILLIVAFWFSDYFLFEEMTTALALIIPMFATYTTVIIRNIIDEMHPTQRESKEVTVAFTFISFFIPSLFTFFIAALIILKALNIGFDSFEQFKILLGLAETIFALYVGQIISKLFNKRNEVETPVMNSPK
jgi:hypothetical protein